MKPMFRLHSVFLLAMTMIVAFPVAAHTSGGISFKDAWIREAPPNAPVLAAYMTLENHTASNKILTQASSSLFGTVEFHRTEDNKGMTRMVRETKITVPAEGSVKFTSGGLHIMLIGPNKPLKAGDKVSLTLSFADGSTSVASFVVKKASSGGMDHGSHHDMQKDQGDHHNNDHHNSGHSESITPGHNDNHHSH